MSEFLTAKEKADELGISTNGLAKTRHLYKHIKKSPRKYLYFKEEESEAIRPNKVNAPGIPVNSRRRDVPFGETKYSKVKGRGGEHFKILNQMRSKLALEGKIPKEKLNDFTEALASKVNENYEEINEQRRHKLQMKLQREDEATRKRMVQSRGPIIREPVRRYPYTMISGAYKTPTISYFKYSDNASDQRNAERHWTEDFPTDKKYYW